MFSIKESIMGMDRDVYFYEDGTIVADDNTGDYLPKFWKFKGDIAYWKGDSKIFEQRQPAWENSWIQFEVAISNKFIEYFIEKELLGG